MRYVSLILAACCSTAVQATDFSVIVDRDPEAIEIYVQVSAPLVPSHLGPMPDNLIAADGTIDISPFRNGTADYGDVILRDIEVQVDGKKVSFESMSMMVHPLEFDMPFNDPIDAITSISVCNVPDPLARFDVDGLRMYLGAIAYPVNGYGDLSVQFTKAANIFVKDFKDGRLVAELTTSVSQDKPLELKEPKLPWYRLFW